MKHRGRGGEERKQHKGSEGELREAERKHVSFLSDFFFFFKREGSQGMQRRICGEIKIGKWMVLYCVNVHTQ